jgi:hypothetical protein
MRVLSDHHVSKEELAEVKVIADTASKDSAVALSLYNELIFKINITSIVAVVSLITSLSLVASVIFIHS